MKRENNRKPEEIRPIVMKAGVIKNADGSAMVSMGKTTAIAAVYGPTAMHPKRFQHYNRAFLRTVYKMVPFSTTERVRPGPSRRSIEISKVIREALEPAIFLEEYPKTAINIHIDVIQANAGTRTAAINAASVALADAGIFMRDLVVSVAAGKIGNEVTLDLGGKEEDMSKCDLPIAYMPRKKEITLLQMDGNVNSKEAKEIMNAAIKGCETLYKKQKEALRAKWVK